MAVCPGCGRCSECGRGGHPWPSVPQPWYGPTVTPNTIPYTAPYTSPNWGVTPGYKITC